MAQQEARKAEDLCQDGEELRKQEKFEDAVRCFDRALLIDPKSAWAWTSKGLCLEKLGQLSKARDCYEKGSKFGYSYVEKMANYLKQQGF